MISENSVNIVVVISLLLGVIFVFYAFAGERRRKADLVVYQKLSKSDKQIIDVILETEKQAITTLGNIAATYQETMAKSIKMSYLQQRLFELEKAGLVKSSVIKKRGGSTQTWKAEKFLKMRISFRLEILTVLLLLIGITLTVISSFFFTQLDQVVHGNLYNYGLQFSYEWAQQYWTYSRLMMTSLATATAAACFSIAFILLKIRTCKSNLKIVTCALLFVGILSIFFSMFFFTRLDSVVHGDLYNYGLQFSYEWAQQYWTYLKLIQGLLGLAITINALSTTLIITSAHARKIWITSKKSCAKLGLDI